MIKINYFDERELLVRREIETKTLKGTEAKGTEAKDTQVLPDPIIFFLSHFLCLSPLFLINEIVLLANGC